MNLIGFTFLIDKEKEDDYITEAESLKEFWDEQDIVVSLFRDTGNPGKLYQIFLTEKSVDEITALIQSQEQARHSFELIKEAGAQVFVSSYEQLF